MALVYLANGKESTPRAARVLAALNAAEHDAAVAVWDTKFTYWSARPVNAMHELGPGSHWKPLLPTPTFPGFVSGHSGYSRRRGRRAVYFFPPNGPPGRQGRRGAMSRLYAGIHLRADNEYGLQLGHRSARAVVDRIKRDGADL